MKKQKILLLIMLYLVSIGSMAMSLVLESTAFQNNGMIPQKYSCEGEDSSPELTIHGAPQGTQSYVLMVNDPDAPEGDWVHWILFNIPATITHLEEATPLPLGAISGKNSWDKLGYGGPCPPQGTHRYVFTLYALDTKLTVNSNVHKADILNAMQGHILESTQLTGFYTQSLRKQ